MNEQGIIKQFAKNIETEFDINETIIYKNSELIMGSGLDTVSLEYYSSVPQTTVFKTGNKSCMISMITVNEDTYMIILSSLHRTAFDGLETKYMISEFKKLAKRLGDF